MLVLFVLLFALVRPSLMCQFGPSLWCSSMDIAKECDTENICRKHVWKNSQLTFASKVRVDVYWESLCPYSRQFIVQQLYPTFKSVGNIINISMAVFGNAQETKVGDDHYIFKCQHGPQECIGNLYDTCAIALLKEVKRYLPYINCIERTANISDMARTAKQCVTEGNVTAEQFRIIEKCAKGVIGNELEHVMAMRTKNLSPPLKYVPWIVLNGVHNEKIQDAAQKDLLKLVCETYKGPIPDGCKHQLNVSLKREL